MCTKREKKEKNIEIIEQLKDSAAKKSAWLAAKKVLNKYKKNEGNEKKTTQNIFG